MKWGGKQHPSMTNPLHLCFWRKACTSLAGHGEEESGLQWIVKLDRVTGADLESSQIPPGSKKKRCSGLHALLSSQIPPCALYHEAFSSKTCLAESSGSSLDKRGMRGQSCYAEFKESETLLPAGASHPLLLQHISFPEKWIYSALNDLSEAVVWSTVYGGLSYRGITSHTCAVCSEPGFLCVPAPVRDFYLPLKSQVLEVFDMDGMT